MNVRQIDKDSKWIKGYKDTRIEIDSDTHKPAHNDVFNIRALPYWRHILSATDLEDVLAARSWEGVNSG